MQNYSMTIRMGAAHWDATIHARGRTPETRFDFRKMTREQRNTWKGMFMASVRRAFRQRGASK